MKIARDEVVYVSHLARLVFDGDEIERFTTQLNSILLYMEKLGQVDTEGVLPLTNAFGAANAFRPDTVADPLSEESSLAMAPEARGGLFVVPRVIE